MRSMRSPARWARVAGIGARGALAALLVAAAGCDQPTGIVVTVEGVTDASQLWLTVGTPGELDARQPRFLQTDETGPVPYETPFPGTFEIYLEREALMGQARLALVVDSAVGDPVDVRRDGFVVEPDPDALVEVKLTPRAIGKGQWVCAGAPPSNGDRGFVVATRSEDHDCDRDGWFGVDDRDDSDPLQAPSPTFDGDLAPSCTIKLGTRPLPGSMICGLGQCKEPTGDNDACLLTAPRVHCKVGTPNAEIALKEIAGEALPTNPDWELIKLGPARANGYFNPSIQAPGQWTATFELGELRNAWFVLRDRARGATFQRLVHLELNEGMREMECAEQGL